MVKVNKTLKSIAKAIKMFTQDSALGMNVKGLVMKSNLLERLCNFFLLNTELREVKITMSCFPWKTT